MDFKRERSAKGICPGTDNIKAVLEYLGNPQNNEKAIHISGTNGKGSIGGFVTNILSLSGYKVGRFFSPAVFSDYETIQIVEKDNTSYITKSIVDNYYKIVCKAEESLWNERRLTSFETETVIAFLYFNDMNCDYIVVEVGMGGKNDATNVMNNKVCEILASISMDHMSYLGNTLSAIAKEKSGIIIENSILVSAPQEKEVLEVIYDEASKKNTLVTLVNEKDINIKYMDIESTIFNYKDEKYKLSMAGSYQVINACVAIEACKNLGIDLKYIKSALEITTWRGRFSVESHNPLVIIDGAHNKDAFIRLSETVDMCFKDYDIIMIIGAFKDKDIKGMIGYMAKKCTDIVTFTIDNARTATGSYVADCCREYCNNIYEEDNIKEAVSKAKSIYSNKKNEKKVIICCGSLSYISQVKKYL